MYYESAICTKNFSDAPRISEMCGDFHSESRFENLTNTLRFLKCTENFQHLQCLECTNIFCQNFKRIGANWLKKQFSKQLETKKRETNSNNDNSNSLNTPLAVAINSPCQLTTFDPTFASKMNIKTKFTFQLPKLNVLLISECQGVINLNLFVSKEVFER